MIQIRLFGDFEIVANDQPIPAIRSERRRALLAYMIVHHKAPQSRQSVAFTLWPQSSERQARTNLRKELHRLRKEQPAVEAMLKIDTDLLAYRPAAIAQADVIEFERLLQRAATAENPTCAEGHLCQAVALYQGDFFPQSYDNWVLATRERLRSECIGALDQLIDFHTGQRHYRTAVTYLQQLLQLDPLCEESYRRLMHVYALNSDLGGINQTFQRCRQILAQEFSIEPSEPTIALYQQLQQRPSTSAPSSSVPDTAVARTLLQSARTTIVGEPQRRLVGRTAQWRLLEERWQQIQQHKQQCILIQGTAGIGKTALVHAFMAAVCEQQGSAIYARTSPATHPPAYGPVIDWLRSGLFTAQLRALQQIWQAEIAALLPELQEGLANLHIHLGTATAGHYSHLQDALCALLQQVQQPLLLVLDDLQWCDMATLDWLQRLLTGPVALPILLIATARTDELYDTPAITLWSLRLREAQRLHEIELPLLDERQSATLTNLLLETKRPGDRIAPVTAAEVYRVTEGHPQMIEELLSLLPQQPVHRRYHVLPQVIPTESTPNAPLALPKADAAIAVRLAQRSPAAQTVVGMAACIGPSVTLAQLLAVADENVHTLLDALDELLATGILYEGLNGTYAFVHGRVRQVARMQLSQARGRYYQQRLQQAVRYS